METLAQCVLGPHPLQQSAIKRWLLIVHSYCVVWAILAASISHGYAPASSWWVVALGAAGQALFYVVLRAGLALGRTDPLLCFPQALFGGFTVVLGYALVPYGQGPALQALFIILVFDLHRLRSRDIAVVAAATVAMLVALVALQWRLDPASIDVQQEVLNLSMAVLLVPLLTFVSDKARRVQRIQIAQKAELNRVLGELHTLSRRDALTGAVNRRHMLTLLDDEGKRQRRSGQAWCLVLLDVDFFKRVNDTHGHAAGDAVLRQIVRSAATVLRPADVLARWGGEEFLVLLPDTAAAQALAVIDCLRRQVEGEHWQQLAPGLAVTFSAGVAAHAADEAIERTLERADGALYRAKQLGRNRVEQA
jgi:diguanylate cyclase (GGDEF)-like protein